LQQLQDFFEQARRYRQAKAAGGGDFRTDLKFEAMLPVLEGKLPAVSLADRERTIRTGVATMTLAALELLGGAPTATAPR